MFELRIVQDEFPMSPDEWGDDCCFIIAKSERELWIRGEEDIEDYKDTHHIYPLFAYIHSGIALSLGREYPFNCKWDSGQIGYVLISKTEISEPRKAAESLVEVWNSYLSGDVWGYEVIEKTECQCCNHISEEVIESCYGFYSHETAENEGRMVLEVTERSHTPAQNQATL